MNDAALSVAVRAARNAAAMIEDTALDLKRLPSFSKEHAEIASSAEDEAGSAIATTLLNAFPEHAVLGKQPGVYEGRNKDATYRWVIEPLDGSANFVRGYPYYAISIALTHGAEITHAVVLDPVRDELFTAIKNQGAQVNGVPARVSSCTELQLASTSKAAMWRLAHCSCARPVECSATSPAAAIFSRTTRSSPPHRACSRRCGRPSPAHAPDERLWRRPLGGVKPRVARAPGTTRLEHRCPRGRRGRQAHRAGLPAAARHDP